jgi:hypothetical protein
MGGGPESSCVSHVYGLDGALLHQVGISRYFNMSVLCLKLLLKCSVEYLAWKLLD